MAYLVDSTRVAAEVAKFTDPVLTAWRDCLSEIAIDPHPRFGFFVDSVLPIPGFRMRTWAYEIAG